MLIAGITLTVAGFFLTFGPLAPDLGGTDTPPFNEPAGDSPVTDADDEHDATADTNMNGDEATGTEEIDNTENNDIRGIVGEIISGNDESERTNDDETQEKCVVE